MTESDRENAGKPWGAEEALSEESHLASVGAMMGSLIHDLRNPFNIIKTSTYFLQSKMPDMEPRLARHFDLINQACGGAVQVMESIVEYSRLSPLALSVQPLLPILQRALTQCGASASRVEVEEEAISLSAYLDADYLTLAIRKLLQWSLDRTPEGPPVHVNVRQSTAGAQITVEDCGPSIYEQQRLKLFTPLSGPEGLRSTNLSAAIVGEVLHFHGASVELNCPAEQGCIVSVTFPEV